MRVVAALSGGVDSAVAAARLVDAGHDVLGVTLALADPAAGQAHDARRVADVLGIDLEIWDAADRFSDRVVGYFVNSYASGLTPNPCLRCNQTVKFPAVLEGALARGYDAVATGHYARLETDGGAVRLYRGDDAGKDQSYVLAVLTSEQLRRCLFPLYGSTKAEVRAEAAARGLPVAHKPDSVDVCFISDGDTSGFLLGRLGEAPGDIVDETGRTVGTHRGAYPFTVGQRRGLHLGVPAADGEPRYVLGVNPDTRTVTVGPRESLRVGRIAAEGASWTGEPRAGSWRGLVQVRAHGAALPATIEVVGSSASIVLDDPVYGVAPGQGAVFYDDALVVGAAMITGTAS